MPYENDPRYWQLLDEMVGAYWRELDALTCASPRDERLAAMEALAYRLHKLQEELSGERTRRLEAAH